MIPTLKCSSHGGRNTSRGERAYDIYSLLLKERIIFLAHLLTTRSPM